MREERGFGLRRFADRAGLHCAHLSRIELGQRNPRPETLKKIADAFGVPVVMIARQDAQGPA